MALPQRSHLRRLTNVWIENPLFFVTVCVAQRRPVLSNDVAARFLGEAWSNSRASYGWSIGRYVIMPDHVHFFARPALQAKPLAAFMRDWKKWTAKKLGAADLVPRPVWQPEFFDHLLRSASSYSEKWEYVRANPVRAGLVAEPEQWPFAGEIESLSF